MHVEHAPTFRVVVRFTTAPAATLARYVSDPEFVAVSAPSSLAALEASLRSTYGTARALGLPVEAGLDVASGRIKLYTTNAAAVRAAVAAGTLNLSEPTDVVEVPSLARETAYLYAGEELRYPSAKTPGAEGVCTSGFTLHHLVSNTRNSSTAGHCSDPANNATGKIYRSGIELQRVAKSYNPQGSDADYQAHAPSGFQLTNWIYEGFDGSSHYYTAITAQRLRAYQVVDSEVCKFGVRGGWACGLIRENPRCSFGSCQ